MYCVLKWIRDEGRSREMKRDEGRSREMKGDDEIKIRAKQNTTPHIATFRDEEEGRRNEESASRAPGRVVEKERAKARARIKAQHQRRREDDDQKMKRRLHQQSFDFGQSSDDDDYDDGEGNNGQRDSGFRLEIAAADEAVSGARAGASEMVCSSRSSLVHPFP